MDRHINKEQGVGMKAMHGMLLALGLGCVATSLPAAEPGSATPTDKRAWFGDLHLHTSNSYDAAWASVKTTPRDAYRYAQGFPVDYFGHQVKRKAPLDFLAVSDHAEYMV